MPFIDNNGIRYYTFDLFPREVTQAVFTRQGGVSPEPWASLNVGGTVGDEVTRVRENRYRSFAALGRKIDSLFDVWQVHSAEAVIADAPRDPNEQLLQADAIFTDKPEVTLYMRFADCVPILFFDSKQGIVGLAHAGWLGTVRGMTSAAVAKMHDALRLEARKYLRGDRSIDWRGSLRSWRGRDFQGARVFRLGCRTLDRDAGRQNIS